MNSLRLIYAFWPDRKRISPADIIKLSKTSNNSSAILRSIEMLIDYMQNLLRCVQASEEYYWEHIVGVRIISVVMNMMSYSF